MFSFLALSYLVVVSLILDRSNLSISKKHRDFAKHAKWVYERVMGVNVKIKSSVDSKKSKILVIANHPGLTDFLTLSSLHQDQFLHHDPIFVIDRKFTRVPILGKYWKNSNIPIGKGISDNEMECLKQFLEDYPNPFVLYLFPEGTICCSKTFKKSQQTEDGKFLHHLLIPKTKALTWFLPCFEQVFSLTIVNQGKDAHWWKWSLFGYYPHTVQLFLTDISDLFSDPQNIYHDLLALWKQKDAFFDLFFTNFDTNDFITKSCWVAVLCHLVLFILTMRSTGLFSNSLFLISSIENYIFRRHYWFHKFCLGLLFFDTNAYFAWACHFLIHLGFSTDAFKNKYNIKKT
jgi:hypothetical protein